MSPKFLEGWALILGASSGFGAACALSLAEAGMNIIGIHLDRKGTLPNVERIVSRIRAEGREAVFFNMNAADAEKRAAVLSEMATRPGVTGGLRVLVHSLAFGTLKPYIAPTQNEVISQPQMEMTMDVMANSLVYWTQEVVHRGLMGKDGRVFSLTSAGGARVWRTYGAVSAAKAALEAHTRQLALELGPLGISVNAIRAGVTDTPALRKIPGHEEMIQLARKKNPGGRLTTPDDAANAIVLLSHPKAGWITGNVIGVDGGEFIVD